MSNELINIIIVVSFMCLMLLMVVGAMCYAVYKWFE